jgi:hypothetical protein
MRPAEKLRVDRASAPSHLNLRQNRDPITNLGDRHGRPIRYEADFNTHFDPLIFIVPVGLNGVDVDCELPRRGLYAYDLRSYRSGADRPMKLQAREMWPH